VTPFSAFLSELCRSHRILQKAVAYQIGVDPSYLSAMVSGRKGPPSRSLVHKIQEHLALTEKEYESLNEAVKYSQRLYRMPPEANPQEYELVWKIFDSVGKLKPAQISAITEVLKL